MLWHATLVQSTQTDRICGCAAIACADQNCTTFLSDGQADKKLAYLCKDVTVPLDWHAPLLVAVEVMGRRATEWTTNRVTRVPTQIPCTVLAKVCNMSNYHSLPSL